ncbi:hypothetical protein [Streptomyces narbonensis]|uniref:hypothetical protein n=1 Tax=Streptomyces narbonensis TaxID=67333 RepID=UPI0033D81AD8
MNVAAAGLLVTLGLSTACSSGKTGACLENGLTVEGINTFWQNVAQGALLVVAVVIQQRRSGERVVGLRH